MKHLRELRENRQLLQKEVAQALNIDRTTYVKYENGQSEPSIEMLIRIANYFGVSLDYLLENETENKEPPTEEAVDQDLMNILVNLSPDQLQRVKDFLAGMTSTNTTI